MNPSLLRRAVLLLTLPVAASAQVRLAPVEVPMAAPAMAPVGSISAARSLTTLSGPSLAAPALSAPAAASALVAPAPVAAPASPIAVVAAPALPAAAAAPAAAAGSGSDRPSAAVSADPPSAREQLSAAAETPESDRLWTGGMPGSAARKMLAGAHWQTTKFFFGSRVKLLRQMIAEQENATAGKRRAVDDLEGLWLDWRVAAYSGRVTTSGFEVADRAVIRRQAEKVFDRRFPKDAAARAAFRRYLDRVDAYVPAQRPSNYRKLAFSMPFDMATAAPEELAARIDSLLAAEHLDEISAHRATRQDLILGSFKLAATGAIREANAGLPEGKKIVAAILLGSYSIGQSTPKSDIDYQLVTQDGSPDGIKPFNEALDRLWRRNRIDKLESFQFALPPSREVVVESFREGFQVISPDPAAVKALSKDSFMPDAPSRWARVRGAAFGAFYRAWCWSYLRLADFADMLKLSGASSK